MNRDSETEQVIRNQYRNAGNLNARIYLHQRFSTNSYGWYRWLFDRLVRMPDNARILELGCGPGAMWANQMERVSAGWAPVLSDFSPGMVVTAQHTLSQNRQFNFAVLDAQHIPFAQESFDAVIANHMLYHVPDRGRAFSEIQRVLRAGGLFFAATNGEGHLAELDSLLNQTLDKPDTSSSRMSIMSAFSLDNGLDQLSPWFERLEMAEYTDGLLVTEPQPLIDYICSMIPTTAEQTMLSRDKERRLRLTIEQAISSTGAFSIVKRSGLFTAARQP